jgi:hypothetical protein
LSRSELERLRKFVQQGLDLDRPTMLRVLDYAIGTKAREHKDGCAWWRGAGCDCEDETPGAPFDEQFEAGHA